MKDILNLTFPEIQEVIRSRESSESPPYNVLIYRNIMLEPIVPYLKYELLSIGLNPTITIGEYDNVLQETILNSECNLNTTTNLVLVFLQMETLSSALYSNILKLNKAEIEDEVNRIKEYIQSVIENIRNSTNAPIIFYGFPNPVYSKLGILESQIGFETSIYQQINNFIRSFNEKSVYIIDANTLMSQIGYSNYFDKRYWHIGKAPFKKNALIGISSEIKKIVRALNGKSKKCLVLDCDNTLWGGIVGEDGVEGIKLSKNYPGSSFYAFQKEILSFYDRGIILALCSKNNEKDVFEVLHNHDDMLIKEEHIATHRINWQDKASNIREIAEELNIGLDSLVFVDDSNLEIELVNLELPEVQTIHLDSKKAIYYKDILAKCGFFDSLSFSEEDKVRGKMYKSEVIRKKNTKSIINIENYLQSLDMKMIINECDKFSIPRVSQLTQRTNQFNLTTKRYSESEIKALTEDDNYNVIYFQLEDKFGGYGTIGVCILEKSEKNYRIDTLLMSCRVLGRGVEKTFMNEVMNFCAKNLGKELTSRYIRTRKNEQVENLFDNLEFDIVSTDKNYKKYRKNIEKVEYTSHIKVINKL